MLEELEDRNLHWWGWYRVTYYDYKTSFLCKSMMLFNFIWIHWHTGYPSDYYTNLVYQEKGPRVRLRSIKIIIFRKVHWLRIPFLRTWSV